MENKEVKRKRKITFIIVLLFVITTFISILLIQHLTDIGGLSKSDIFEIDKKVSNKTPTKVEQNDNPISEEPITPEPQPTPENPEEPENPEVPQDYGDVIVDWYVNRKINIFENEYFNNSAKLAPGTSSEYKFMVINRRTTKVKYFVKFSDKNDYNINIKFRLKKGNEYIAGDANNYVLSSELDTTNFILNPSDRDLYTLEWKWDYENPYNLEYQDGLDTTIGETIGSNYSFFILVSAEDI